MWLKQCLGLVLLQLASSGDGDRSLVAPDATTNACDVTTPNGVDAGAEAAAVSHGNQHISVGPFGLWPNGTVVFRPGGPGFVAGDGSLGMKFGWQRGVRGQLEIGGRRLDAPAAPLRAEVPHGYGDIGFQPTHLVFSAPGCWEVTGRVGDASLTFVTKVVLIGDGPARRRASR